MELYSNKNNIINEFMTRIISGHNHTNLSIYNFIVENKRNTINSKFKALNYILTNRFIEQVNKEKIFDIFNKAQRIYHFLIKKAYLYKYHKSTIKIKNDLCWNELELNGKNTMTLFHNNSKYLFALKDLINIIETAITHSTNFFSIPLESKNPFNNLPFTKSNLYNIYFALKRSLYRIPLVIQQYFLCDFDLKLFSIENEYLIRDVIISNFLNKSLSNTLCNEIDQMLYKYCKKIVIDKAFPKQELIEIMKPYLYLYILHMYHIEGVEKRLNASSILTTRLRYFNRCFPRFGKKMYKKIGMKDNKPVYKAIFYKDHPKFTLSDIKQMHYNNRSIHSGDFVRLNVRNRHNTRILYNGNAEMVRVTRAVRNIHASESSEPMVENEIRRTRQNPIIEAYDENEIYIDDIIFPILNSDTQSVSPPVSESEYNATEHDEDEDSYEDSDEESEIIEGDAEMEDDGSIVEHVEEEEDNNSYDSDESEESDYDY